MTIINSEGRFILVEKALAYPFTDIITNTHEGPLFDLSVDLEHFQGVPYIKAEHVKEMAAILGMITKEEADILIERNRVLEEEATKLPAKTEELVNGIDRLVSAYRGDLSISTADAISAPPYLLDVDPDKESTEGLDGLPSDSDKSGDNVSGESGSSDIEPSGIDGKPDGKSSGDIDELDEILGTPDGQNNRNARNKRSNSVPASTGDEFGFDNSGAS